MLCNSLNLCLQKKKAKTTFLCSEQDDDENDLVMTANFPYSVVLTKVPMTI